MSKTTLLRDTLKLLQGHSPNPIAEDFLDIFYQKTYKQDRAVLDATSLSKLSLKFSEMLQAHSSGQTDVRIFSPTKEDHDWSYDHTIIQIITPDKSFIVDSLSAELQHEYSGIHLFTHPILWVSRNKKNKIEKISSEESDVFHEAISCSYIELKSIISSESAQQLQARLEQILGHVDRANTAWQDMLSVAGNVSKQIANETQQRGVYSNSEYQEFIDYLIADNFTFLGYTYVSLQNNGDKIDVKEDKKKALGLYASDMKPQIITSPKKLLAIAYTDYINRTDYITISKDTEFSTVHRRVPFDIITIKTFNKRGEVSGEHVFVGLFTSNTYSRSVLDLPIVRKKAQSIISESKNKLGSHNVRARRHILEKYPRDDIFSIDQALLREFVLEIMALQERQTVSIFSRLAPHGRLMSCIVYVPKDRFETSLRISICEMLEEEFDAVCTAFRVASDDSAMARVQYSLKLSDPRKSYEYDRVRARLNDIAQSWPEKLKEELIDEYDEQKAFELIKSYVHAFEPGYRHKFDTEQARYDIRFIEQLFQDSQLKVSLYRPAGVHGNRMRLRLYMLNKPVGLSDILPIITNMGLRVISEIPSQLTPNGQKKSVWIHDFLLEKHGGKDQPILIKEIKKNFEEAIEKLWYGQLEKDLLNSLIITAGLDYRAVGMLRAYVRYMQQIRYPYSSTYVIKTLTDNPDFAKAFWKLFEAQFKPKEKVQEQIESAGMLVEIDHKLDDISSIDHDKILRSMLRIIRATQRTNFYQVTADGTHKDYLSLKIKSDQLEDVPQPHPWMEIFVYAPDVEGVHLRFGPIARGGLRWSDRHEDFRTEVLGLVKAQMVKNSVIIPVGSKGGFIVKKPTSGLSREEFQAQGIECYKKFIRGLLDVTDNKLGDRIIQPDNTLCRDDEDPYLVVAADKGTATFSDIANGIAAEYGFWLDDAFASGGSAGYDHKLMGITAKGAWESVKRHFRELNHDTQTAPFDVVGVGDMGGDVFGNGMLLSDQIRLIGAFNHRHIFCDPTPDPARSFKERQRLFAEVKGWDSYNAKLLSKGGQVYERSEKNLKLTKEIKDRFDIDADHVTPDELILVMLKSRTDLLWFGGIGTYIKAEAETHEQVSDKANDSIRVNGKEVRARVIGEGANLGVTQKGRIEFAAAGGFVNTDFIDNSAGVDCSDHEVNVKILLQQTMMKEKNASRQKRDLLLEKMTEDVASLVLRNNYQQTQALSLMKQTATQNAARYERLMTILEERVGLNRKLEDLPTTEEMDERVNQKKGLSRPELSVILSYSKIAFFNELMRSDLAEDEANSSWVIDYFPADLQKKYKDSIPEHALAKEIINTQIANSIINRMGPIFILNCMAKSGATATDVVKAYLITRDVYEFRKIWTAIEELDNKVPAELQLDCFVELNLLIEHACLWFLKHRDSLDLSAETLKRYRDAIPKITSSIHKDLPDAFKEHYKERLKYYMDRGLQKKMAETMALLPRMASMCDVIYISDHCGVTDYAETARIYYDVGQRFRFSWLRERSRNLIHENIWDRRAASALRDLLYETQSDMALKILMACLKDKADTRDYVSKWVDRHGMIMDQLDRMLTELEKTPSLSLSMLMIAEQRLRQIS